MRKSIAFSISALYILFVINSSSVLSEFICAKEHTKTGTCLEMEVSKITSDIMEDDTLNTKLSGIFTTKIAQNDYVS